MDRDSYVDMSKGYVEIAICNISPCCIVEGSD